MPGAPTLSHHRENINPRSSSTTLRSFVHLPLLRCKHINNPFHPLKKQVTFKKPRITTSFHPSIRQSLFFESPNPKFHATNESPTIPNRLGPPKDTPTINSLFVSLFFPTSSLHLFIRVQQPPLCPSPVQTVNSLILDTGNRAAQREEHR